MPYEQLLKQAREAFESHEFWRKRCVGTPLENDLPVRSANITSDHLAVARREIDRLRERVRELEAEKSEDTRRIDWLEANRIDMMVGYPDPSKWVCEPQHDEDMGGVPWATEEGSWREAVDAARRGEG